MIGNICELNSNVPAPAVGEEIIIPEALLRQMEHYCVEALPHKAYGLVGGPDIYHPTSLYRATTNLRNTSGWKEYFESFGEFYYDPDRGFVIDPREFQSMIDQMEARGEMLIGIFHSHRCRCAEPSQLDIAMSTDPSLLCYIVSVVEPSNPETGVFRLDNGYSRLTLITAENRG